MYGFKFKYGKEKHTFLGITKQKKHEKFYFYIPI